MSFKSLWVGRAGLRAGWRFLLFLVLAQGASAGLTFAVIKGLGYQPAKGWVARDFWISETCGLVAAIAATWLMARIGRRRTGEFGFPLATEAPRLFGAGILAGGIFVGLLAAALIATGGMSLHGWAHPGPELRASALAWGLAMLLLGGFEEASFRGYPLVALAEGMGFWPAAMLLSALFGALHYFTKPMETLADAFNIAVLALLLCLTFRRTGSLWFAAGFHAAFDFAALVLFGAPNTGNNGQALDDRLVATEFHGPQWLTGGPCGMEASLLVLPVAALAFLFIHRAYGRVRLETRMPIPKPQGAIRAAGS